MPSIHAAVRTKLPTIEGSIPHPYNRPAGCPFHPRCPEAMPGRCDRVEPATRDVAPGHAVACLLYDD
jgi:peptide/nickel transport system ATP-binding protein